MPALYSALAKSSDTTRLSKVRGFPSRISRQGAVRLVSLAGQRESGAVLAFRVRWGLAAIFGVPGCVCVWKNWVFVCSCRFGGVCPLSNSVLTNPQTPPDIRRSEGFPRVFPVRARVALSRGPGGASRAPYFVVFGCGVVCGGFCCYPEPRVAWVW